MARLTAAGKGFQISHYTHTHQVVSLPPLEQWKIWTSRFRRFPCDILKELRGLSTGWNNKIIALEKTTWFHSPLMKTGFLFLFLFFFFFADHLLVGQLCTNPERDRSLLSCLKVTQCSMSEIGDAPLHNLCSLPIQVMTTGPLPAPSKIRTLQRWGHSSTHRTTLRTATVMVFGVI